VNLKVDNPCIIAVTIPALLIVATDGLLDDHVPLVDEVKFVVFPTHITEGPLRLIIGLGITFIGKDSFDVHPVVELVNVNFAVPAKMPFTRPVLLIVATVGLDETQIPPELGSMLVLLPTHIGLLPPIEIIGFDFILINAVGSELQPLASV
jgi:hypothetical protein